MAISCWYLFNERLKRYHFIGIGLMCFCAILLSYKSDQNETKHTAQMKPLVAILITLVAPLSFTMRNIWVKKCAQKIDAKSLTISSQFILGVVLLGISIFIFPIEILTGEIFVRMFISSFIDMFALIVISEALNMGHGAPVGALCSVQTIIMTILNAVFYGEIPLMNHWAGMVVGVLGTVVLSLGPLIN